MGRINLVERAERHADRTGVFSNGESYSYSDLLGVSESVAASLLDSRADLAESRVAFSIPNSFEYAAVQWGVWRAGGVAVPLSRSATEPELEHVLSDSGASAVVGQGRSLELLIGLSARLGIPLLRAEDTLGAARSSLPDVSPQRPAMILYTSGTTSKPKGVVTTHENIEAQITSLVEAWDWRPDDRIPLFLPLHHVHGIVNVLSCALWSGAMVETFESFDAEHILDRVAANAFTIFMAVPTIYVKLIRVLESAAADQREAWVNGFRGMRLMISGSAALPASVHEKWTDLTGQRLLERYGMTEIGMGISNPLEGERRPGMVGQPLPGVEIRLVSESGALIEQENEPGEIQIRGRGVFGEYWNNPDATRVSFQDGWFKSGDMATLEDGYYRILGRLSVDIIKSGGYKLSALEIEDALRQHPAISECSVVGVADDTWGEAVAVAATLNHGTNLDLDGLKSWAAERLSKYKIPKKLLVVSALPRNAMGKVVKPEVRNLFLDG